MTAAAASPAQRSSRSRSFEEHPADLWRQWAPSKLVPLGDAPATDDGRGPRP